MKNLKTPGNKRFTHFFFRRSTKDVLPAVWSASDHYDTAALEWKKWWTKNQEMGCGLAELLVDHEDQCLYLRTGRYKLALERFEKIM